MYKNVLLINKITCYVLFILAITLFNNILSFFLLSLYFYYICQKQSNYTILILNLINLISLAVAFNFNNYLLLKLFLFIDYFYYFFILNENSFFDKIMLYINNDKKDKKNKKEIIINNNKIVYEINNELKKGEQLKQNDITKIKSNIKSREEEEKSNIEKLNYIRFSNLKKEKKDSFDLDNQIYLGLHLLIIVLTILVE